MKKILRTDKQINAAFPKDVDNRLAAQFARDALEHAAAGDFDRFTTCLRLAAEFSTRESESSIGLHYQGELVYRAEAVETEVAA